MIDGNTYSGYGLGVYASYLLPVLDDIFDFAYSGTVMSINYILDEPNKILETYVQAKLL